MVDNWKKIKGGDYICMLPSVTIPEKKATYFDDPQFSHLEVKHDRKV